MGDYPTKWEEYVGQKQAVHDLQLAARSAKRRGQPMDHTIIHSPVAGVGKTFLAELVAAELGGKLHCQTEPIKPAQVRMLFLRVSPGDVLFLDEFHQQLEASKRHAEWLLPFLERGVIPGAVGEIDAPGVTVIAATTDIGVLTKPFLRRFTNQIELEPYSDEEAALIAASLGRRILTDDYGLPAPAPSVCAAIARAASNNPGDMLRIVKKIRDMVFGDEELDQGIIDGDYAVDAAVTMAGYTPDGLTGRDRRYLVVMFTEFQGGPAGERVMASRLGEVPRGIAQVENKLTDAGLLLRSDKGRVLTEPGLRRAIELVETAEAAA